MLYGSNNKRSAGWQRSPRYVDVVLMLGSAGQHQRFVEAFYDTGR
jgi:hypothetical protein